MPRQVFNGTPRGLDEIDLELKNRMTHNTHIIRNSIRDFLDAGDFEGVRNALLNFYWLKLGTHELMFDRIQYGRDKTEKIIKEKMNIEEPELINML